MRNTNKGRNIHNYRLHNSQKVITKPRGKSITKLRTSAEISLPYIHINKRSVEGRRERAQSIRKPEKRSSTRRKIKVIAPLKKQDLMGAIAEELAKLDTFMTSEYPELSNEMLETTIKSIKPSTKMVKTYNEFIQRFIQYGKVPINTFIHSFSLAKRASKLAKTIFDFESGEFLLVYASCLYISIKMLNDLEKWFIEDFSLVSGIEEDSIEKMEEIVLFQLLEFRANVSQEIFESEMKGLKEKTTMRFCKDQEEKSQKKKFVIKCLSF